MWVQSLDNASDALHLKKLPVHPRSQHAVLKHSWNSVHSCNLGSGGALYRPLIARCLHIGHSCELPTTVHATAAALWLYLLQRLSLPADGAPPPRRHSKATHQLV